MICPKCGFEQSENPECMRCGIVISRYKGPSLGSAPSVASPSTPEFGNETVMLSVPPPPPPPDAGGTLYGGPAPAMAAASGGTVYGGLMPAPGVSSPGPASRPAFRGTFEIGKVLGESFSIYFSNFIPFVLLTALALSPVYLAQAYMGAAKDASATAVLSLVVFFASSFLCPYIATAAITYGVFQQMRGRDTSIGDCLSRGLAMLFPVLLLAIVQFIGIALGMMACLVPGILFSLYWTVSIPAAVEERPGIFGALRRSKYLTENYRGEIFGVLFVISIINGGLTLVAAMAAAKDQTLLLVLSGVKDLLFVGLSATATAVMYYRLRSIKESIDVDQIASVFA